jgi:hypothetical protein
MLLAAEQHLKEHTDTCAMKIRQVRQVWQWHSPQVLGSYASICVHLLCDSTPTVVAAKAAAAAD